MLWVHLGQLFFFSLEKRAVLGVFDLFVVPLPFYLVVFTCILTVLVLQVFFVVIENVGE